MCVDLNKSVINKVRLESVDYKFHNCIFSTISFVEKCSIVVRYRHCLLNGIVNDEAFDENINLISAVHYKDAEN